jgi:hypothetical protein
MHINETDLIIYILILVVDSHKLNRLSKDCWHRTLVSFTELVIPFFAFSPSGFEPLLKYASEAQA